MNIPPWQFALGVVALVSLAGIIIAIFQRTSATKGYEEYREDIDKIRKQLGAEMFRDGDDLVITGNSGKFPTQVRFSYSETTPGLNIRMAAPVSFRFSVVPKGERATEGRVLVRTGDDMFDARFAARTDHPTQAKMLVTSKAMRTQMERLCCSSKTFLTLVPGSIELSELVIPSPYTARHVSDHIQSMSILGKAVDEIPGAETIKIVPYQREKSTPYLKFAIAAGVLMAIAVVFYMKPRPAQPPLGEVAVTDRIPEGIMPIDLPQIPRAFEWRAATEADFTPLAASLLRDKGAPREGRVTLELDDTEQPQDVAYVLVSPDQADKRLVILQNGVNTYDTRYTDLAGVARVPKDRISNIEWKVKPVKEAAGDAIMVLREADNELQAVVMYPVQGQMIVGIPQRVEDVDLQ